MGLVKLITGVLSRDAGTVRLDGREVAPRTAREAMTVRICMLSSVLAGLAGIVFSFSTAAGYSLAAVGVELDTIAAVVTGGTPLSGGQGSVIGTFIGVLIQGLIQTYINFDGTLSCWWTKIATGILLFAFIALQQGMVRLASRSRPRKVRMVSPTGVSPSGVSPSVVSRGGGSP
jgi:galactofuranose transport system permease protein